MGYLEIPNLYKNTTALLLKQVYCLEKIHGTSTHIAWRKDEPLRFFAGGCKHEDFVAIFNQPALTAAFQALGHDKVTVYGEGYGGKMQKMSKTYGDKLRFVAFDVQVGDTWLDVPDADDVVQKLGLQFVPYTCTGTSLAELDAARDAPSQQAVRNGITEPQIMEGIVLRPMTEMTDKRGNRIISKHKRPEFRETHKTREVDPTKLEKLQEANAIALEWVTDMRLDHVLDKVLGSEPLDMKRTPDIIRAMFQDVTKESQGEVEWSPEAYRAVGTRTAQLYKQRVMHIEVQP